MADNTPSQFIANSKYTSSTSPMESIRQKLRAREDDYSTLLGLLPAQLETMGYDQTGELFVEIKNGVQRLKDGDLTEEEGAACTAYEARLNAFGKVWESEDRRNEYIQQVWPRVKAEIEAEVAGRDEWIQEIKQCVSGDKENYARLLQIPLKQLETGPLEEIRTRASNLTDKLSSLRQPLSNHQDEQDVNTFKDCLANAKNQFASEGTRARYFQNMTADLRHEMEVDEVDEAEESDRMSTDSDDPKETQQRAMQHEVGLILSFLTKPAELREPTAEVVTWLDRLNEDLPNKLDLELLQRTSAEAEELRSRFAGAANDRAREPLMRDVEQAQQRWEKAFEPLSIPSVVVSQLLAHVTNERTVQQMLNTAYSEPRRMDPVQTPAALSSVEQTDPKAAASAPETAEQRDHSAVMVQAVKEFLTSLQTTYNADGLPGKKIIGRYNHRKSVLIVDVDNLGGPQGLVRVKDRSSHVRTAMKAGCKDLMEIARGQDRVPKDTICKKVFGVSGEEYQTSPDNHTHLLVGYETAEGIARAEVISVSAAVGLWRRAKVNALISEWESECEKEMGALTTDLESIDLGRESSSTGKKKRKQQQHGMKQATPLVAAAQALADDQLLLQPNGHTDHKVAELERQVKVMMEEILRLASALAQRDLQSSPTLPADVPFPQASSPAPKRLLVPVS